MTTRYSTRFGVITGGMVFLGLLLTVHAGQRTATDRQRLQRTAELVQSLELSDLCLFTEASYTRHLSLADLRTPFQEYPLAMEHFPSGSLTAPPAHLTESHAAHD